MKDLTLKQLNMRLLRNLMKGASLEEITAFNERVQSAIQERQDEEELKRLEEEERAKKIEEVMRVLETNGLTISDLKPKRVEPEKRYEYPINGGTKTWSGKGPKPAALLALLESGRKLEDFLIN
ncbi:H-NS family nucleoid-associated regulatory protein [Vibrio fluvialis]|uniref:H-NS histone family protein n=1 Tax=Vibrio fluvialis TaxID=676 RepID=UPI0023A95810|nr:H-NS family nucleoid-associated regulatory protein [Vibrio fluvialis]MDE5179023.1 H-NS family nucleoid-associated regulatory protein [Vibrio fluvialis]